MHLMMFRFSTPPLRLWLLDRFAALMGKSLKGGYHQQPRTHRAARVAPSRAAVSRPSSRGCEGVPQPFDSNQGGEGAVRPLAVWAQTFRAEIFAAVSWKIDNYVQDGPMHPIEGDESAQAAARVALSSTKIHFSKSYLVKQMVNHVRILCMKAVQGADDGATLSANVRTIASLLLHTGMVHDLQNIRQLLRETQEEFTWNTVALVANAMERNAHKEKHAAWCRAREAIKKFVSGQRRTSL